MKKIKWHRSDSIGSTNTYLRELNGGDPLKGMCSTC